MIEQFFQIGENWIDKEVIIRKDYKNGEPTKYQNRGPQGSHPLH